VWIEAFKNDNHFLRQLVEDGHAFTNPYVLDEIIVGGVADDILEAMRDMPCVVQLPHDDYRQFIMENHRKLGGVGFVDLNLIASCLEFGAKIYTYDKALQYAAKEFGVLYEPAEDPRAHI
jgi:predicted nucleic acid-binding protein